MGRLCDLYLTMKGGGNIIVPTPYWTAYELMAKSIGAETKLLRTEMEDGWRVDLGKLEAMIDKDTKMIILNNPNNPTSKVMDRKRWTASSKSPTKKA